MFTHSAHVHTMKLNKMQGFSSRVTLDCEQVPHSVSVHTVVTGTKDHTSAARESYKLACREARVYAKLIARSGWQQGDPFYKAIKDRANEICAFATYAELGVENWKTLRSKCVWGLNETIQQYWVYSFIMGGF